jgi:outer membrane protein assembly factor BamB
MKRTLVYATTAAFFTWLAAGIGFAAENTAPGDRQARAILDASGVSGGLIVHLGCGDGTLTAALRAGDGFAVHGLDTHPDNVARAREQVKSRGVYGAVSVDLYDGQQLPYIDNLVNLIIVSEGELQVAKSELTRVLAPQGVVVRVGLDTGTPRLETLFRKPRPEDIDEWTHYLHGPSGNAVARDSVVGPPRRMQWVGSPRYSRHHDRMSSVSAVVSAGGRVFYIFDEAPPVSILTPPQWSLIARDAFNGTILWKRRIETWHSHLWPLKSGPAQLPRRLVAAGERVYVTLDLDGPLTALDAATGETVRTYEGTSATEEVILSDDMLLALVNDAQEKPDYDGRERFRKGYGAKYWDGLERKIVAIRADTGEVPWNTRSRVLPVTLAADSTRVVFHDGESVVCLRRDSGRELWRSKPVPRVEEIRGFYAPILVLYEDVVLFSGGETAGKQTGSWYTSGEDTMTALSAQDGKVLWTAYHPPSGYRSAEDLLVADGLVWTGETTSGRAVGVFTGRDPHTGEVKREFPPDVKTYWFHHRCYRGKATDKYLLMSRTGTEFLDVRNERWQPHHWVRGACLYGVMPANGLLYAPQHPCACYLEAKLSGFCALAPGERTKDERRRTKDEGRRTKDEGRRTKDEGQRTEKEGQRTKDKGQSGADASRLVKGPAYGDVRPSSFALRTSEDWPTYRHDAARSGFTRSPVSANLQQAWQTAIGGKLTPVTVADGKLFVASVDTHTVHALDALTGQPLWQFTAGGRVDSPPTIHQGRVLFGSADGWVYCLCAADGALAWRFRAAPLDRRLMAFEQLESVWPVHGSVLVREGVLYCVSGRSMFLDGGLRLWRLDPASGDVLSETVLDESGDAPDKDLQSYVSWLNMPTGLPDILSSDDRHVYMRSQAFRPDGTRLPLEAMPTSGDADAGAPPATQNAELAHLFSPTGFLDDSWWHRTYWLYGSRFVSGWCGYFRAGKATPAGRILVFDDSRLYSFGRKPKYYRWTTPIEHQLFATDKTPPPASQTDPPQRQAYLVTHHWSQDVPLWSRGMVLAAKTLFVAGPADTIDEEQAFRQVHDPAVAAKLAEQAAALRGGQRALLWAVDAADGSKLADHQLDAPPVFDGMAAAHGRLYVAETNGQVVCLAGE